MKQSTASTKLKHPAGARGIWRKIIFSLLGVGLAAFIITGLMPKPVAVEMARVDRGPLTVAVLEEGKTRIRNRYIVSSPVPGYLRRVPVRAGDPIVAGETVLAVIQSVPSNFLDPRARAQADAAVRSAEAAEMQKKEQIDLATSDLALARKNLDRADRLRKKGAIAAQEFDTANNRVEMLENQLEASKFASKVAEFELELARAARLQTSGDPSQEGEPITVRAPVSGFVLYVNEESARTVTPGLPIMEVGDPLDLEAEIELLSSDAVNVKPGADVSIEQWGGGEPLQGQVSVVEPGGFLKVSALGVEEQRVKVRVNFAELPKGVLGDRYRVEARIVTWSGADVLQIPTGALFRRGTDWMTFVVVDGKAELTKVKIAHSNGVEAEVLSGVSEGQDVILHPPDRVTDGGAVVSRRKRNEAHK
jgi:HlyD family secretion protein